MREGLEYPRCFRAGSVLLLQPVHQGRAGPIASITSPIRNVVFGDVGVVPKLPPSRGGPGIDGSQNATNLSVDQRSASTSELERVGKQTSGSVDGRGEWGEDGSSVRAGQDGLKDGLKKWKKGDRLFLVDELLALPSNSSPSDNVPPLRNGI